MVSKCWRAGGDCISDVSPPRKPAWKDGSTATCVLAVDNTLYIANLGDSRVCGSAATPLDNSASRGGDPQQARVEDEATMAGSKARGVAQGPLQSLGSGWGQQLSLRLLFSGRLEHCRGPSALKPGSLLFPLFLMSFSCVLRADGAVGRNLVGNQVT